MVAQRTDEGLQACKDMLSFMKKRAELEADYGKRLAKLCTSAQPAGKTGDGAGGFGGTCLLAWQAVLDASQEQARAHVLVSKQLEENVIVSVTSFVKDMEAARKKLVSDGQRVLKERKEQEDALAKAHHQYDKACEARDAAVKAHLQAQAENKAKDLPKLASKVDKAESSRVAAEEEYKFKIKETNSYLDRFHSTHMPKVLDDLQHLETVRIHLYKTNLKKAVRVLEGPPPVTAKALLTLKGFVSAIDNDADVRLFIEESRSPNVPAPPYEFVPYGDERAAGSRASLALNAYSGAPGPKPATAVFGCTLDEIMAREPATADGTRATVPRLLPALCAGIMALDGARSEGLFRLSGEALKIKELRAQLDRGNYDLSGVRSVHILTGTLKLWFRELVDPLVPNELYDACLACAAGDPPAVRAVFERIPPISQEVIAFLMRFLRSISTDDIVACTKMTPDNLAMVFAPSLLRCPYDNPQVIFENAEKERKFTLALFRTLNNIAAP